MLPGQGGAGAAARGQRRPSRAAPRRGYVGGSARYCSSLQRYGPQSNPADPRPNSCHAIAVPTPRNRGMSRPARPIEDLGAVIAAVGGTAAVYGHSSGAALVAAAGAGGCRFGKSAVHGGGGAGRGEGATGWTACRAGRPGSRRTGGGAGGCAEGVSRRLKAGEKVPWWRRTWPPTRRCSTSSATWPRRNPVRRPGRACLGARQGPGLGADPGHQGRAGQPVQSGGAVRPCAVSR